MDWQIVILQKDTIYYFKYGEFWGIFTINTNIPDNSIQTNIRFTIIVCEYIILFLNYPIYPIYIKF